MLHDFSKSITLYINSDNKFNSNKVTKILKLKVIKKITNRPIKSSRRSSWRSNHRCNRSLFSPILWSSSCDCTLIPVSSCISQCIIFHANNWLNSRSCRQCFFGSSFFFLNLKKLFIFY